MYIKLIVYICGINFSAVFIFMAEFNVNYILMLQFMTPFFKSKQDVISEKRQELFKAYEWIRKNNNTISDEILDLMYNSAKEKIDEIYKK